ncbi:hypothetical protein ACTFIR_005655 [Dictyostelium discoideum]
MKLKKEDVICNWKINENKNICDYIVLFINDQDSLTIPNDPITLTKPKEGEEESNDINSEHTVVGSLSIKITLSNTNLMKINSIYIESQSRVQEFSINDPLDYIGTHKSYLLDEQDNKNNNNNTLYASEFDPGNIPPTSILLIKFLSLLNKTTTIISKIIIDCRIGPPIIKNINVPPPLINPNNNNNNNNNLKSNNDMNSLMSLMSMLKVPSGENLNSNATPPQQPPFFLKQSPPPQLSQKQQLIQQQQQRRQQKQQQQIQLQKEIEDNIKRSIIESENRIIELMEKRFDSIFNRIESLEKKFEILKNNNDKE